ncbi:MAG: nucleoside triphosphate pyrophosphohydrolase [Bacteroidales bacterium]|nr:nucleoside triphosphate pyrophosphohydrolase [Bacteroidales bacterium]
MESKTYTESEATVAFHRLSEILNTLRRECPWDKVQTMKSLRYLTIEEVHELSEAVVSQSADDIKKELGDLAMHILFYCKIAEEQGLFSTADVYNTICEKLIDRHPFIYRKEEYHGESWEQLKMKEGRRNVLEGVPDSLPSLVKAVRMQEKVAGMDKKESPDSGNAMLHSALPELEGLDDGMSEEAFGELLFALVDWARRHGINADDALCGANRRFKERYAAPTE